MLNAKGEVVGVLSTKVGDLGARATTVDASLADHHAVAVAPDDTTRAFVAKAGRAMNAALTREPDDR